VKPPHCLSCNFRFHFFPDSYFFIPASHRFHKLLALLLTDFGFFNFCIVNNDFGFPSLNHQILDFQLRVSAVCSCWILIL
jgi:hypothetical protein